MQRFTMSYRLQLNQYLQDKIAQSLPLEYASVSTGDGKYEVTLRIGDAAFNIQSANNLADAKEYVSLQALTQLRGLQTETAIRQRLGLSVPVRSPNISAIRSELLWVRERLAACEKKSSFELFETIYYVLDKIEKQLALQARSSNA